MSRPKTKGSFVPGDKRINRDGRPKNSTDLSALFRRIGAEVATKKDGTPIIGPDGKPMTVLEAIARQWAQNPKQQADFVERGFGKVPQQQQITGADGGPIETKQIHDLSGLDDSERQQLAAILAKLEGASS